MAKYKVGDKVRIRSWESMEKEFEIDAFGGLSINGYWLPRSMRRYCGEETTITEEICCKRYKLKGIPYYYWKKEMFEKENQQSIHITQIGNEVHAMLKENEKVIKRSKDTYSKEGTFDFEFDSKLAIDRLFDSEKEETKFKPCLRWNWDDEYLSDIGIKTNMTLAFGESLYTGDVVEVYDTLSNKIIDEEFVCGDNFVMGFIHYKFENGIDSSGKYQIRKVQSYKDLLHNQKVGSFIVKKYNEN